MITVQVDSKGLPQMAAFLAGLGNQLPFATSLALNQTARDTQLALAQHTPQAFASPVPFTKNAFRYTKSTKAHLVAEVFPSPDRPYFVPQSFGGPRRLKDYEGFLRGLASSRGGALPGGKLIPTALAINAAGNPKKSLFGQIESRISTTDQGGFFLGTPKGGTTPGVYRRSRGKLHPYFLVIDEPQYQPRFQFERVGNATVARSFMPRLEAAVERAIASSR